MKSRTSRWTGRELRSQYAQISFPEYQREPNVWSRDAKQRLVDSMLREFDIAALYFYVNDDGSRDCVDGRQRIGAIMSFLGENPNDADNSFEYKVLNEIYSDEEHPFSEAESWRFSAMRGSDQPQHQKLVESFLSYNVTVVELSETREPREFNLQFARLNLGTIINSGEKLHAMVGELRDECFGDFGRHRFLAAVDVPTRRFSREQLAAQILAQVFSVESAREEEEVRGFARTRHFDLQRLFKEYTKLGEDERRWMGNVRTVMDRLSTAFATRRVLRNRAIVVSTVLLAYERGTVTENDADDIAEFMVEFDCRLRWQVGKGLDVDGEYRYLIEFQRNLTQASVERRAVAERAAVLDEEYQRWRDGRQIKGDAEYRERVGEEAGEACRKIS